MLRRMVLLLWGHPMARVQFPDEAKMMEFAAMIQQREPMVDNIIVFMDRELFPVQCRDKRISQNAMNCGYDCVTMVNNMSCMAKKLRCILQPSTFQEAGQMVV
jgi:hypothetical protein